MRQVFDVNAFLREILTEVEIQQLEAFNANPAMKEAVRKVLLCPLYYQGVLQKGKSPNPLWNFLVGFVNSDAKLTDEQVGRYTKVQVEGINQVEVAFDRIADFKPSLPQLNQGNDAI